MPESHVRPWRQHGSLVIWYTWIEVAWTLIALYLFAHNLVLACDYGKPLMLFACTPCTVQSALSRYFAPCRATHCPILLLTVTMYIPSCKTIIFPASLTPLQPPFRPCSTHLDVRGQCCVVPSAQLVIWALYSKSSSLIPNSPTHGHAKIYFSFGCP